MKISKKLGEILIESSLVTEQQLMAALSMQKQNKKPLGEILIEQSYIEKERLEAALAKQYGSKLGEILIDVKAIDFDKLQHALNIQKAEPRYLGDILVDLGYITAENLIDAQAKQYKLDLVNLSGYTINPDAFNKVPGDVLKRYAVLPIDIKDGFLVVATSNPEDVLAATDLEFLSGMHIKFVLAHKKEIKAILE